MFKHSSHGVPLKVSMKVLSIVLHGRESRRRARSVQFYPRSMVVSPKIDKLTSELCTIIGGQVFWSASQSNELVEDLDYVLASQSMPAFDCQSFACKDIDNRQRTELLAVA